MSDRNSHITNPPSTADYYECTLGRSLSSELPLGAAALYEASEGIAGPGGERLFYSDPLAGVLDTRLASALLVRADAAREAMIENGDWHVGVRYEDEGRLIGLQPKVHRILRDNLRSTIGALQLATLEVVAPGRLPKSPRSSVERAFGKFEGAAGLERYRLFWRFVAYAGIAHHDIYNTTSVALVTGPCLMQPVTDSTQKVIADRVTGARIQVGQAMLPGRT